MRFTLFKAKKEEEAQKMDASEVSQGAYTDHGQSAYSLRMATEPFFGEELEAFEWVMNHLAEKYPDLADSQTKLIDKALDEGWMFTGDEGELRVTEEAP